MNLEDLKKIVMQQALEKGFGVKPEEVNVPEKILLIASEIAEAEDFERDYTELCDAIAPLDIQWRTNPNLSERTRQQLSRIRGEYEKEMGDVLQRTLHLGGIYGFSFATPPSKERNGKYSGSMYERVVNIHTDYRKKRMDAFERGVVGFAHYCMDSAAGFDISRVVIAKIEENRNRVWDKTRLNETLSS